MVNFVNFVCRSSGFGVAVSLIGILFAAVNGIVGASVVLLAMLSMQ